MSQKNHIWPAYVDMMTVLLLVYILLNCMFSIIIENADLDHKTDTTTTHSADQTSVADDPTVGSEKAAAQKTMESQPDDSGAVQPDASGNQPQASLDSAEQSANSKTPPASTVSSTRTAEAQDALEQKQPSEAQDLMFLQAYRDLYNNKPGDLRIKFAPQQESYLDMDRTQVIAWLNMYKGKSGTYTVGVFVHDAGGKSSSSQLVQQTSLYYQLMAIFKAQGIDLSKVDIRNAAPSNEIDNVVKARFVPCQGECAVQGGQ
ncbi:hypothetical protein [Brucella anthropi]|uniref:hypothetical protein n=1 Tax=Brucella anthropi TaxID=529 RepID=UPI0023607827|nr:hypothetical protein [Brucella anthropi]